MIFSSPAFFNQLIKFPNIAVMKFIIKSQKDGCYFSDFQATSGSAVFGEIQNAKIYFSKAEALNDLHKMGQYGPRVIAITKIGRNVSGKEKSSKENVI